MQIHSLILAAMAGAIVAVGIGHAARTHVRLRIITLPLRAASMTLAFGIAVLLAWSNMEGTGIGTWFSNRSARVQVAIEIFALMACTIIVLWRLRLRLYPVIAGLTLVLCLGSLAVTNRVLFLGGDIRRGRRDRASATARMGSAHAACTTVLRVCGCRRVGGLGYARIGTTQRRRGRRSFAAATSQNRFEGSMTGRVWCCVVFAVCLVACQRVVRPSNQPIAVTARTVSGQHGPELEFQIANNTAKPLVLVDRFLPWGGNSANWGSHATLELEAVDSRGKPLAKRYPVRELGPDATTTIAPYTTASGALRLAHYFDGIERHDRIRIDWKYGLQPIGQRPLVFRDSLVLHQ